MINSHEKLITKILDDLGYNCGLVGKLHIAPCHPSVCKTTENRIDDGYRVFHWSHHPEYINNINNNWVNNEYMEWLEENNVEYKKTFYQDSKIAEIGMDEQYHHSTWCTNKAISFIKSNRHYDTPWALSLNYYDPHHPFDPPKEYFERYLDILNQIPLPKGIKDEVLNKPLVQQKEYKHGAYNNSNVFNEELLSDLEKRYMIASYYAMCDLIDVQVGRLMETLKETGQLDNTIVIYMSDHGDMLGDHGMYLKGALMYDELVHVPLIFYWKDRIKTVEANALVELVDIAPTILDLIGVEKYAGMQGKSLISILNGKNNPNHHRENVYSEFYNSMNIHEEKYFLSMIQNDDFKMVVVHGSDEGELYDLINDKDEFNNLWKNEDFLEVKIKMLKDLTDRLAFKSDPLPIRVSDF